jgi:ribose 1,5-bisphosphokinase PhnN
MTTETELLNHTGWFEYPQLKARSVILAATNQTASLKQTVATLIERFGSGVVADGTRAHLQALRVRYPEAMRSIEL